MTDLSTRAEQAKPDEARGLLEELILHPRYAGRVDTVIFGLLIGLDTPEAHLAAAMMLVKDQKGPWSSWNWAVANIDNAATPALALIAAIARSIEP